MADTENTFTHSEPGHLVYACAMILGAAGAFVTATLWLDVTPAWVALAVGTAFSLPGVLTGETIVETVIFTLILGVMVFIFITVVPGLMVIKAGLVPGASGLSIGKLTGGIWKEIAA